MPPQQPAAAAAGSTAACSNSSSKDRPGYASLENSSWGPPAKEEGGPSPSLIAVASSSPAEDSGAPSEEALASQGAPKEASGAKGVGGPSSHLLAERSLFGALETNALTQFLLDSAALGAPLGAPLGPPSLAEESLPPACPSPILTEGPPEGLSLGAPKQLQGGPEKDTALALAALNSPTALAGASTAATTPLAAAATAATTPLAATATAAAATPLAAATATPLAAAATDERGLLETIKGMLRSLLENLRMANSSRSSSSSSSQTGGPQGALSGGDSLITTHISKIKEANCLSDLETYLSLFQGTLPPMARVGAPNRTNCEELIRSLDTLCNNQTAAAAAASSPRPQPPLEGLSPDSSSSSSNSQEFSPPLHEFAESLSSNSSNSSSSSSNSSSSSSSNSSSSSMASRCIRYPPESLEAQKDFCVEIFEALKSLETAELLKRSVSSVSAAAFYSYHKNMVLSARAPQQLFVYMHIIFNKLLLHAVHKSPNLLLAAAAEGSLLLPSNEPLALLRGAPREALAEALAALQLLYEAGGGPDPKDPLAAAAAAAAAGGLRLRPFSEDFRVYTSADADAAAAAASATATPVPSIICSPTIASMEGPPPEGEGGAPLVVEGCGRRGPPSGPLDSACISPLPPAAKGGPLSRLGLQQLAAAERGGLDENSAAFQCVSFPAAGAPGPTAAAAGSPASLQQQFGGLPLLGLKAPASPFAAKQEGQQLSPLSGVIGASSSGPLGWPLGPLLFSPEAPRLQQGAPEAPRGQQGGGPPAGCAHVSFDATHNRWIAFWRSQGKSRSKSFSCSKYGGREAAKVHALGFRKRIQNCLLDAAEGQHQHPKGTPAAAAAAAAAAGQGGDSVGPSQETAAAAAELECLLAGLDVPQETLHALQHPLLLSQAAAVSQQQQRHFQSACDADAAAASKALLSPNAPLAGGDSQEALSALAALQQLTSVAANLPGAPRKQRGRRGAPAAAARGDLGAPRGGPMARPRSAGGRARSAPNTPGGPRRIEAAAAAAAEGLSSLERMGSSGSADGAPPSPGGGGGDCLCPQQQQQQQRLLVVSGSITFDRSQNRFMAQWKTSDGCKHSKSFYLKNYPTVEEAQMSALRFKENLLAERDSGRIAAAAAAAGGGSDKLQHATRPTRARGGDGGGPPKSPGGPLGPPGSGGAKGEGPQQQQGLGKDGGPSGRGGGPPSNSLRFAERRGGGASTHEALECVLARSVQSCLQEIDSEETNSFMSLASPLARTIRAAVAAAAASSNNQEAPTGYPLHRLPVAAAFTEEAGGPQQEEGGPLVACKAAAAYSSKRCRVPAAAAAEPHYKRLKHLLSAAAVGPPSSPSMPTLLARGREEGPPKVGPLSMSLQQNPPPSPSPKGSPGPQRRPCSSSSSRSSERDS